MPADASGLRLAARALGAALVLLAAIPGYLMLTPPWRTLAVRLACAAAVVAVSMGVLRRVRASLADAPPFAIGAGAAVPAPAELDERFVRLRDELRFGIRNGRYFDMALWPRLERLAGSDPLAPPPRRRRSGPTREALEGLIGEIERRP